MTTQAALPSLVGDYADGLSQVQVAKKHGLHVQTVRKRLIAAGVDIRARLRVLGDEYLRAARVAMARGTSDKETRKTYRPQHRNAGAGPWVPE